MDDSRPNIPVHITNGVIAELLEFTRAHDLTKFMLVADRNTQAALGAEVEQALRSSGLDLRTVVLQGDEVIADEAHIVQVLIQADREERTYLAVGSGTITDITRVVSHRTRNSFISLPTATSVDGFTSIGAPLVIDGMKRTYICHPPVAVFADLPTLCAAPPRLAAAGFGDMLGKLLSIADWRLGHILWDEPYDDGIARRFRAAAWSCIAALPEIQNHSETGTRILISGLIDSGFGMLDFGNSNPASGAEHHMSHLWEVKLLREHRPALLHGSKVGLASILTASRYEVLRGLGRDQAALLLQRSQLPGRGSQVAEISQAFGSLAGQLIQEQAPFLDLSPERYQLFKDRVLDQWVILQEIAASVPLPRELTGWLAQVGAPVTCRSLGLSREEVSLAFTRGHYFRNRMTINKFWHMLGLPPVVSTILTED
jgi:glycerol-1-phosphate dehydrogenase [NAD(P)+]